jgi:hypothetical protein
MSFLPNGIQSAFNYVAVAALDSRKIAPYPNSTVAASRYIDAAMQLLRIALTLLRRK